MTESNDLLFQQLADPLTKRRAFSEVMRQHQQRVYFFIRRMVLDHEDAADITQNVFLKAWKGIGGFRGESKMSTCPGAIELLSFGAFGVFLLNRAFASSPGYQSYFFGIYMKIRIVNGH